MDSLERSFIKGAGTALATIAAGVSRGNPAVVNGVLRAVRSYAADIADEHSPFHSAHANVGEAVNDRA